MYEKNEQMSKRQEVKYNGIGIFLKLYHTHGCYKYIYM